MPSFMMKDGSEVIYDEQDEALVLGRKWHRHAGRNDRTSYAVHQPYVNRKKVGIVWLHREIMKPVDGQYVDHINGNGLDNRRCNLRLSTTAQNRWNSRGVRSKTGFRGVYRQPRGKYQAGYRQDGRFVTVGFFDDPVEAARAYDRHIAEVRGEFAVLNFPIVS